MNQFIQYDVDSWVNLANIALVYRDSGVLKFDLVATDGGSGVGLIVPTTYENPFLAAVRGLVPNQ